MPRTKKAPSSKSKSSKSKATKTKVTAKKSVASKAKTTKASKKSTTKKSSKVSGDQDAIELLNETGRRRENINPPVERRKRRRQIDPTTCERDYSDQEIEFMQAMDDYKRQSGRMFPTCSEILEVLIKLGYRQVAESSDLMFDPNEENNKQVEEESLDTEFDDEVDDE